MSPCFFCLGSKGLPARGTGGGGRAGAEVSDGEVIGRGSPSGTWPCGPGVTPATVVQRVTPLGRMSSLVKRRPSRLSYQVAAKTNEGGGCGVLGGAPAAELLRKWGLRPLFFFFIGDSADRRPRSTVPASSGLLLTGSCSLREPLSALSGIFNSPARRAWKRVPVLALPLLSGTGVCHPGPGVHFRPFG